MAPIADPGLILHTVQEIGQHNNLVDAVLHVFPVEVVVVPDTFIDSAKSTACLNWPVCCALLCQSWHKKRWTAFRSVCLMKMLG